jgi:hypothetical protein
MLHFGQTFGSLNHPPQAFIVELVSRRPSRSPTKRRSHRDSVIRFRNILMNCIVGEAGQRMLSSRQENFNLVSRGEFLDAVESVAGFFVREH